MAWYTGDYRLFIGDKEIKPITTFKWTNMPWHMRLSLYFRARFVWNWYKLRRLFNRDAKIFGSEE